MTSKLGKFGDLEFCIFGVPVCAIGFDIYLNVLPAPTCLTSPIATSSHSGSSSSSSSTTPNYFPNDMHEPFLIDFALIAAFVMASFLSIS